MVMLLVSRLSVFANWGRAVVCDLYVYVYARACVCAAGGKRPIRARADGVLARAGRGAPVVA